MAASSILSDPEFGLDGWIDCQTMATVLANKEPVLVVDVRNPEEFAGLHNHIEGARNIPLTLVTGAVPDLLKEDHRIVLVCDTDQYSRIAASLLRQAGRRDILVLRGGMDAWRRLASG